MNCSLKKRDETIAAYLAGSLNEEEMKAFEEHYFQCEDCFHDLRIAGDALNLVRDEGPSAFTSPLNIKQKKLTASPEKKFFHKIFRTSPYNWGIAAAATAAAVIIIFLSWPENPVPVKEDGKNGAFLKDTVINESSVKKEKLIADLSGPAFKPNNYMEEWINERTRSVNDIIDSVYSPGIGEQFTDSAGRIMFKWRMKNDTAVSLKILDNAEEEILTAVPAKLNYPEFSVGLNSGVLPQPGIYYWRIESEEEVLYTGKFYLLGKTQ